MIFDIKNLNVTFSNNNKDIYAVRGVDFYVKEGEILGIAGESGSGKSVTTLSFINLLPKNAIISGDILYREKSVLKMTKEELQNIRGNKVGFIFQEPSRSFDPIYNIEKTFAETILAHNRDVSKDEIRNKTVELLKEVRISNPEERIKNFPHQFSGGMLQRIMIALSLVSDPEILIADEPTTALDVTIQAQIVSLLVELKKKRGLSIVFISHNLGLLSNISDRLIIMYGGLIMEEGEAKNLLKNRKHPYTEGLLESLPKFGDHYTESRLRSISGTVPNPQNPEPGCPFAPRCRYVKDKCKETIPVLKGDEHKYRCIL